MSTLRRPTYGATVILAVRNCLLDTSRFRGHLIPVVLAQVYLPKREGCSHVILAGEAGGTSHAQHEGHANHASSPSFVPLCMRTVPMQEWQDGDWWERQQCQHAASTVRLPGRWLRLGRAAVEQAAGQHRWRKHYVLRRAGY